MVQTADWNEDLADLRARAAELEFQLSAVHAQIAKITNAHSPICSLPVETLEHIIYNCHLDDLSVRRDIRNSMYGHNKGSGMETIPFSIIASHVSQRWRDVAVNSARLWTTLDFLFFQRADLLQIYLDRSKFQCLDITFCLSYDDTFELDDPIPASHSEDFVPLIPHLERCRSLTIRGGEYLSLFRVIGQLHDAEAPHLQYLEVTVDASFQEGYEYSNPVPEILLGGSPVLKSLYLRGIGPYSCWPSPSSLTDVELDDNGKSVPFQYSDFRSFLLDAVSLTRLTLRNEAVTWDMDEEFIEVIMPNLLSLHVSNQSYAPTFYDPLAISGTIVSPRLRVLYLAGMVCTSVFSFMSQPKTWGTAGSDTRYPHLQSLRLISITLGSDHVNDCCNGYVEALTSATPGINHLTLLDQGRSVNTRFILTFLRDHAMDPKTKPVVLWPQLEVITTNIRDFQLLREVVLGRIEIGRPLRGLCLHSATLPDELTWFLCHLEVEVLSGEDMFKAANI
jgi:hypothetical protein